MGLDRALEISISGIRAERERMEIISSNIANINTTQSVDGGPYRRKIPLFVERPYSFEEELTLADERVSDKGGGVYLKEVVDDTAPLQVVYNPNHPDADANGMVQMPNISLSKEMVDMVDASKMYEANVTAYNVGKKMVQDTLQIQ